MKSHFVTGDLTSDVYVELTDLFYLFYMSLFEDFSLYRVRLAYSNLMIEQKTFVHSLLSHNSKNSNLCLKIND